MSSKILIVALGFFILSCEPQSNVQTKKQASSAQIPGKNSSATTLTIREGQEIFSKEMQAGLTFLRVSEDSRCPKGTNCVWAGVGVVEVEFLGTYTRPVTLKLSTVNLPKKGYSKTGNFNGYNVELVSLTPEAPAKKSSEKYQITLKISKGRAKADGLETK